MENRYPSLEINLAYLKSNCDVVLKKCKALGIDIAGVTKGASGNPGVTEVMDNAGFIYVCSSRLEHLIEAKKAGAKTPLMMIRIPLLSEVEDLVKWTDCSLVSELVTIKAINEAAKKLGKVYDVLMMIDVGDLREGYWDKEEAAEAALTVERELKNVHLLGVGLNVGCVGAVVATKDKIQELVDAAELIEAKIGRKLEYISGGASSSLMRVWDNDMPARVNMLRLGENLLTAEDLGKVYHYDTSELHQDVFVVRAEIVELKDKPSKPIGQYSVDAFGHTPDFKDRGIRRRCIIALGNADYAYMDQLIPLDEGIELIGSSSDHTVIDIQNAKRDLKVGDILSFGVNYKTMIFLTNSPNVHIKYIK